MILGYNGEPNTFGTCVLTLNVIVYQYGKVASTSLVTTLNKLRGVSAHQCHFFGEEAFRATVTRLCNPDTNDYFFKHSLGQLTENIRAYREYHRKNRPPDDRCIILTVAREPFDWFRSSIVQEIEGHLPALKLSLGCGDNSVALPSTIVTDGLDLLINRIHSALDTVDGDIDALTPAKRRQLDQVMPFVNTDDFEAFLFILSRFLQPHWWFRTQFTPEFGVDISAMRQLGGGLLSTDTPLGSVYLARYEDLSSAFDQLLVEEGLPKKALARVNEGYSKLYASEINAAFSTEAASRLKRRSVSEVTQVLGYAHPT